MRVLVAYNHESGRVLSRLGVQNREKYELDTINDVVDALRSGGHEAFAVEADMDLLSKLERLSAFDELHSSPEQLTVTSPALAVFNLSYGVQGGARYTHTPALLEMIGIPYVGSGPLAHGLALDKVVTKLLLKQHKLPTPRFCVMHYPDFEPTDLSFPLIVKPRAEAVSLGLSLVFDEDELHRAVKGVFELFACDALVEEFIEGREVNVSVLGNDPPLALSPVEILFDGNGPSIFTFADKKGKSGRNITSQCPAHLSEDLRVRAQELAVRVFRAVGCKDFARVDIRLSSEGDFYILEINSLPSLRRGTSYIKAAQEAGFDYERLINYLLEVAMQRYVLPPSSIEHDDDMEPVPEIA